MEKEVSYYSKDIFTISCFVNDAECKASLHSVKPLLLKKRLLILVELRCLKPTAYSIQLYAEPLKNERKILFISLLN